MILPDASPDDLINYHLRTEALKAQERGDGFSVWHGHDSFLGEDVELLINLEDHTGFLAMGQRLLAGRFVEDGPKVNMVFRDVKLGQITLDLDSEILPMNAHRIGVEYAPGEDPKLRLYDKLSGRTIFETEGDAFHELVDRKVLDPKDYPGSGLAYVDRLGLV